MKAKSPTRSDASSGVASKRKRTIDQGEGQANTGAKAEKTGKKAVQQSVVPAKRPLSGDPPQKPVAGGEPNKKKEKKKRKTKENDPTTEEASTTEGGSSAGTQASNAGADIDDIFAKKPKKPPAPVSDAVSKVTKAQPRKEKKSAAPAADDGFADSRGTKGGRRTTDDGYPIYADKELLAEGGGDTPQCPFDCACCY